MELIVATTNRGKFEEIVQGLHGVPVWPLLLQDLAPVVEDQPTFEGNAVKKALHVARKTGKPVLADDSGLVVPALGGRPGVRSARYAGPDATDEENRQKLLAEMEPFIGDDRKATFICVMVLVIPPEAPRIVHGRCDGLVTEEPRGTGGFGYDPIFLLPDLGRTMAELPLEVKNRRSHRGLALAEVRLQLLQILK